MTKCKVRCDNLAHGVELRLFGFLSSDSTSVTSDNKVLDEVVEGSDLRL